MGHPIANDPCYGGELHFGNPEAKRRAEENPGFEGWKGVPGGSPRALKGRRGDGESAQQPMPSSAAVENGTAAAVAPSAGADVVVDGGSSAQQRQETAAGSAPQPAGSPDAAASAGATRGGASATATGAGAPLAEAGVGMAPGNDAGAKRDGEDDEAFMVSNANGRRRAGSCRRSQEETKSSGFCWYWDGP